jgi:lipopolysaccharide/colanic/teichoic acid biosynthesis glycosyltransferase
MQAELKDRACHVRGTADTARVELAKRAFDLCVALVALALGLPIGALIAVAIKLGDRGPVLYRQERVGRGGRLFQLLKFRSMVAEADRRGAPITVRGDPRVTPVGRTLRRWKLDELPQLLNVIRGDMSLVGPRPELPTYVAQYEKWMQSVLHYRPGITDPASLAFLDEEEVLARAPDLHAAYCSAILPRKLELSLRYAQRADLLSDLGVLWHTFASLVHIRRR